MNENSRSAFYGEHYDLNVIGTDSDGEQIVWPAMASIEIHCNCGQYRN